MSDTSPETAPSTAPEGDYGYDLAHDDVRRGQDVRPHEHRPVEVVTETSDADQDYSYDLAHDIPPSQR